MVLFDALGLGWDQLSFELLDLIKKIVTFTNQVSVTFLPWYLRSLDLATISYHPTPPLLTPQHYPHRAARIVVLNTPQWYHALYGIIKPIMSDVCDAKLVFLSSEEVKGGALLRWIDKNNLPIEYGGRSKIAVGDSKYERAMRGYIDKINRRAGVQAIQPLK